VYIHAVFVFFSCYKNIFKDNALLAPRKFFLSDTAIGKEVKKTDNQAQIP